MNKTILLSKPSNEELEKLTHEAMIDLNKAAFPYVVRIFPESVLSENLFINYIEKYCVVPLKIANVMCRKCHDTLVRGIKKEMTSAREKKCAEGAIITDSNNILGASYTTYGKHHRGIHDK